MEIFDIWDKVLLSSSVTSLSAPKTDEVWLSLIIAFKLSLTSVLSVIIHMRTGALIWSAFSSTRHQTLKIAQKTYILLHDAFPIGHVNVYFTMHYPRTHSVNDSIWVFDHSLLWLSILKIPVKNCIAVNIPYCTLTSLPSSSPGYGKRSFYSCHRSYVYIFYAQTIP